MRILLIFALLAASAPAQDAPRAPASDKREADRYIGVPEAIAAGKELFLICSTCHGINGEGGRGPNLINGRHTRRATHRDLFNAIKNGVAGGDMPPLPLPDEKIWQIVAYVRDLSAPSVLQRVPGDPEAGRAVFFGKGGCTECHGIRGQGGQLGPDLSNVGVTRNLNHLREALLTPNARFTPGFTPVRVTTREGRQISGVAKNHSNYSFQMLSKKGQLLLFQSHELSEVVFLDKTWMPENYGERLTADEIQNLLAFLSRQAFRVPEWEAEPDLEEDR